MLWKQQPHIQLLLKMKVELELKNIFFCFDKNQNDNSYNLYSSVRLMFVEESVPQSDKDDEYMDSTEGKKVQKKQTFGLRLNFL